MTLGLIEAAVDGVVAYITANSAAKIAAVEARYADGIELADFRRVSVAELAEVADYPALFVLGIRNQMSRGGGFVRVEQELEIAVLVLDQDEETLRRKVYRYGLALVELMIEAEVTADFPFGIEQTMALDFTPIYKPSAADPFFEDARLTLTVFRQELT